MTTIDIISGFLGAGKTTLIKKLLAESFSGQKIVLIENEFGEIGIDGGFLKDAGIQVTEMNSGCICCSLVGDFGQALRKVLEQYHPDRILIEPSGVGKLSDVAKAVGDVAKECEMQLGSAVTVVNAKKCKMYMKNFGEFFNDQIEHAGTVILSRTQDMKEEKLQEVIALVKEKNPHAVIVTTPWDDLTGDQILSAMAGGTSLAEELMAQLHEEHEHEHHYDEHGVCSCGHHHHGHDADEVFTSWGMETPKKFAEAEIKTALEALDTGAYGAVLRAKGIVPCTDGSWLHFDMVPGEIELRRGSADYTGRLCVIGSQLKEGDIQTLFQL